MTKNMDVEKLIALVQFAKSVGLEEITWEKNGSKFSFRRTLSRNGRTSEIKREQVPAGPQKVVVKAPAVGIFRRAETNGRSPLVLEGNSVAPGQKMGVVDMLGIPKDILCPVGGRVGKIMVQDGNPVEYDQDIFEIEPLGR